MSKLNLCEREKVKVLSWFKEKNRDPKESTPGHIIKGLFILVILYMSINIFLLLKSLTVCTTSDSSEYYMMDVRPLSSSDRHIKSNVEFRTPGLLCISLRVRFRIPDYWTPFSPTTTFRTSGFWVLHPRGYRFNSSTWRVGFLSLS